MEQEQRSRERRAIARCVKAIAALLVFAEVFTLGYFARELAFDGRLRSFLWALDAAESNFYREVDEDALWEDVFSAFSLDPYSGYYTKEDYAQQQASDAGRRTGYGLSFSDIGGRAVIASVTGNSPAEHAGLRTGMTVYAVRTDAGGLEEGTAQEFAERMRTADNASLLCGFSEEERAVYELTAGDYRLSYCLYADADGAVRFDPATLLPHEVAFESLSLPEGTAYLRLSSFHGTAAEEFEACLSRMRGSGKKNLVLDLRGNGGGSIDVFANIAALLLKDAEDARPLVAYAKYRSGAKQEFYAPANRYKEYFGADSRVYVLADRNTASASECLIGALSSYGTVTADDIYVRTSQDGARTYGKGIMQSYFRDGEGNRLKLTVAEIFWPNGVSIHGRGVVAADEAHAIEYDGLPAERDAFLLEFLARIA